MCKRQIYETIMRNISREVKKVLNESYAEPNDEMNERFVIVEAYNDLYDRLSEEFVDAMICGTGGNPDIFIIFCGDIEIDEYLDEGANVYEIPAGMSIDGFERKYKDDEIFLEELKQI